ncbi:quinone oxidoreductase [Paenibacillus sp. LHD-117]|uniref:quinone oxidoreductase family protein n=1 Tax=Paenibacillus sp. LHD-117 TaxID=3071412 RepID=UPI0027DEEC99|nr:quinone oxidoreductase [Paenibacillus sp. LHD-117]MDQ6420584.1 quinone oxidoreductase [Paenibacillus sp. LHD-117]
MKALIFEQFGGPEVLKYAELPRPKVSEGEVLVQTASIGLNFADVYRRKGHYHLEGKPPFILGYEGSGIVAEVAQGVKGIQIGDRVAFADVPFANAEIVRVPFERIIPLPEHISFEQAASVLLQGLTAHYLTNDSYSVKLNDEVLVHAAAGGVGQLLTQLCKLKGARVIGLTSSDDKRAKALEAGADEVLLYREGWSDAVKRWSMEGGGVHAAYDSVGVTLMESFAAVRPRGTVVFYGMAGGDPPHVDPRMLMDSSKTLTGGDLWNHVTSKDERIERANELFAFLRDGRLKLESPTIFPLSEGAEAHRLLESRTSTGKILLRP